jgi:tetratricopeptide (TPR) repeat protein
MVVSQAFRIALASVVLTGVASAQLTDADVEARIREGVLRFERGELAAAQRTFEAVLAERPDHVVANYELAYTLLRQGELERALAIIDGAFARNLPVTAEYYAVGASIVESLGRSDEAVERFQQGIAAFPDNHNLHLNFGITQIMRDDAVGAKASFERAISLQPDHPSAHFFLGQIYANEGLNAAAILALGKGMGFDNPQRAAAAANIVKSIMDNSITRTDDGTPVVVMPVDYQVPPMTLNKFSAAVAMHYGTSLARQRKIEGDMSYESYANAFAALVTEFAGAGIDPASHFAADHYLGFFGPMVENNHQVTFAHLILGSLNPALASAWAQASSESLASFRAWTQSR